jgi:hypothetical protein
MKVRLSIASIIMLTTHLCMAQGKATSVTVIELFTSQGCSSCPAADKLLNEIIEKADQENKPVIGLSYHVSYWNYLGWKDPYSNENYNTLQRKYAEALQSSVYTPQMIIDGKQEFVGSDQEKAKQAIQHASSKSQEYTITLSNLTQREKDATLNYQLNKLSLNEHLIVLLVKKHVENQVPSGENKGRLLKHDNVVIYRQETLMSKEGSITLPIDVLKESDSLIVYAQDNKTFAISAATKMKL